ncbi:ATP-binding protein [Streptomyces griseoaurantiacus]|uniref:Anti-sigma regulatory factor (Ser/Thr protein kinase) n=1 Tax=Streptomyces griseoaurantiacus TaxID=68213 RepID=A0A1G7L9H2_9ACTN|nr:ATP-binding protein [Streptomyces jietaisiensis]SDF46202.1 Anti-sigma regulatory factor (Ser/Thr protein kinase) [Streptomyces jietaisiensis]
MPIPHVRSAVPVDAFRQRFSATRRGARLARLLAAHQLAEWGLPYGTEAHDTAVLVVAELAANAVLHGRVPGRDFALSLLHDETRGTLRIEVTDTHPAFPVRGTPAPEEDAGRGLLLVEALATDWGVQGRPGPGKTVWALCPLPQGARLGPRLGSEAREGFRPAAGPA